MADARECNAVSGEGDQPDTEAHGWRGARHEEPTEDAEDKNDGEAAVEAHGFKGYEVGEPKAASDDAGGGEGTPDPNARSSYRGV